MQKDNVALLGNHNVFHCTESTATIKLRLKNKFFIHVTDLQDLAFKWSFLLFLWFNHGNRFEKHSMWVAVSGIYPFVANVDWMSCCSKQVLIGCGPIIEGQLQTE